MCQVCHAPYLGSIGYGELLADFTDTTADDILSLRPIPKLG